MATEQEYKDNILSIEKMLDESIGNWKKTCEELGMSIDENTELLARMQFAVGAYFAVNMINSRQTEELAALQFESLMRELALMVEEFETKAVDNMMKGG